MFGSRTRRTALVSDVIAAALISSIVTIASASIAAAQAAVAVNLAGKGDPAGTGNPTASSAPRIIGDPAAGKILFERTWEGWQGLGPFFNERSCVACHSLGGAGGAGPNSKNVELLSVDVPGWIRVARVDGRRIDGATAMVANQAIGELEKQATKLHPNLKSGTTVLHSFGDDEQYKAFREALLGLPPATPTGPSLKPSAKPQAAAAAGEPRHLAGAQPIKRIVKGDVQLLLSARNSTAMFGAGIIDEITDAELKMVAADESVRFPTMAGRLLGRFGWRAQTNTLAQFVAGACTVELGVEVPHVDESVADPAAAAPTTGPARLRSSPGTAANPATPAVGNVTPEISLQAFQDLVAFVGSLPVPTRLTPADAAHAERINKGEEVFTTIGCAVCHRASIGKARGIYSDLLVHEMGPSLADSQPAPLQAFRREYYGSNESLNELVNPRRLSEWRTPPLWGVADSAPYLHDGRAPTLDAAILAHGGQAEASAGNYAKLAPVRKRQLLEFLSTLVAPETPERLRTLAAVPPAAPGAADPKQQTERAERAAKGRLLLATAALKRGDRDAAHRWLVAVVEEFADTAAAKEARKALDSIELRAP